MTYTWEEGPVFCFTADIDWASEEVIQYSHQTMSADDLKLTYFNTNPSPYLTSLSQSSRVRLLIHPNFLPESSHGNSYDEVMDYCKNLVPDADGFRTHRYFEVNDIMDKFVERGFKFVSNHCTRCETQIKPLRHRSGLVSFPIFLEDGGYLIMDPSLDFSALTDRLKSPGLKIINFHPAHMAFNTPDFGYTRRVKDSMSREAWNNIGETELRRIEYKGIGVRNIIQKIIEFAADNHFPMRSIHEVYREYVSAA